MTPAVALAASAGLLTAGAVVDVAALTGARARERGQSGAVGAGRALVVALVGLARRVGVPLRTPPDLGMRVAAAGLADAGVAEVAAVKAGAAVAACVVALPLAAAAPGRLWVVVLPGVPLVAHLAPDAWLRRRARRRAARLEAEAPEVLDLVRVATGAGLDATRAMAEVARRHRGLLAAELGVAAEQTALGVRREDVLARLARRCPVPAALGLVAAIRRADRHGSSLAEALASLAADARAERARRLHDRAAKATPKIQLVISLLLVPSVMLVVAAALAGTLL